MLDDDTRHQVLTALLVRQRHSWDQGLTAAVLEQPGTAAALRELDPALAAERDRRARGLQCARS